MIRSTTLFIVVCSTLLLSHRVAAIERVTPAEVDRLAKPIIDGEWCPGLVIALIDDAGPRVFGYGTVSPKNSKPPDGDTFFEIGSVSKTFTGVLLAEMVGRGEVKLDDPVQKYLPDSAKMPQVGERPITLADLSTHASGLPRMPNNFHPANPENPYADYTVEQMYAFLSICKPARKPGEAYEYSNLGVGLLGHVLAGRAGKSYEALVTERILQPLKMSDTRITLDDAARARLAQGYNIDCDPISNWDIPTLAGAGAIRSTANDLVKWMHATMQPPATPLGEAIKLARTPRAPVDDKGTEIGLGWHMNKKGTVVFHSGQTGGYHTFVAMVPDKRVAAVILYENGFPQVDLFGNRMLNRLLGGDVEPMTFRKSINLDPKQLDALVGRYVMPLYLANVTRERDRIYVELTGQPRFRIYPESPTKFFYKAVEAEVDFRLNEKTGRAFMLTLHQNGIALPGFRAEGTPTTQPTGN